MRLSKNQREALEAVHAGRVTYGSLYPDLDRRAAARAASNGDLWVPVNTAFMVDGTEVYGQAKATYASLEERDLIRARWEDAEVEQVPERVKQEHSIAGPGKEYVRPAYERPVPGSQVRVELTEDGRTALNL